MVALYIDFPLLYFCHLLSPIWVFGRWPLCAGTPPPLPVDLDTSVASHVHIKSALLVLPFAETPAIGQLYYVNEFMARCVSGIMRKQSLAVVVCANTPYPPYLIRYLLGSR